MRLSYFRVVCWPPKAPTSAIQQSLLLTRRRWDFLELDCPSPRAPEWQKDTFQSVFAYQLEFAGREAVEPR
jgi:hypothetical protein